MDRALGAVPTQVLERAVGWGTPDDLVERIRGLVAVGLRHVVLNVVPGLMHPPADADHSVFSLAKRLTNA